MIFSQLVSLPMTRQLAPTLVRVCDALVLSAPDPFLACSSPPCSQRCPAVAPCVRSTAILLCACKFMLHLYMLCRWLARRPCCTQRAICYLLCLRTHTFISNCTYVVLHNSHAFGNTLVCSHMDLCRIAQSSCVSAFLNGPSANHVVWVTVSAHVQIAHV